MKYTIVDLQRDFPDDKACLEWFVEYFYSEGMACEKCQKKTKHYKESGRRSYACGVCGNHFHPLANTVLRNTRVPLIYWFYVIFALTNTRSGVSAKQIERELGVTYKTAWRMLHQVRKMMSDEPLLKGEVEIDETYVHANVFKRSSAMQTYGPTGNRKGEILFGMVEREGPVKIIHVPSAGVRTLTPLIRRYVKPQTLIHTDGYLAYRKLPNWGYEHRWTEHGKLEFYREDSYTQNIENVWSHLKRGIKGTYRNVSSKYLQNYANEYAWRYSHRKAISMFWSLMVRALEPSLS